ncbi:MAG TPA: hypothetical protein VE821_15950 [Pyrinomonadaceae bacterium]|nr:hypothetical protein [Pyrinomonadaceae bacterium]
MNRRPACAHVSILVRLPAFVCLILLPGLLYAQNSGLTRQQEQRIAAQQMRDREWTLYHAGDVKTEKQVPVANMLPQLKEDFRQLQLVNNSMMKQVVSTPAFDYKLLDHAIGEINKRAARLKDNLNLLEVKESAPKEPETQAAPAMPADEQQLKASLFKLDGLIMSFVNNPQFKEAGVVSVEHANRAGRDLRNIVELSRVVRKGIARLSKAGASAP